MRFALFIVGSTLLAQQYTISTIAGGGVPPSGVPALSVRLPVSGAFNFSASGDLYFSSGNSVMKVDAKGILTRVAGTGRFGFTGDGGPALNAQLAWPAGLAVDGSGNLFIAENAAHRVRQVTPDGNISTVAGATGLSWPTGLVFDTAGNLYIADTGNNRVRKLAPGGTITTVISNLYQAEALAADTSGNVYVADFHTVYLCEDCDVPVGRILRLLPDGTVQTVAESPVPSGPFFTPKGIAVDGSGNIYIADAGGMVRKLSSSGFATLAGGDRWFTPGGVAFDSAGTLYFSDTARGRIARVSSVSEPVNVVGGDAVGNYWGDGGNATDAGLSVPLGVAVDLSGNLYVSDTGNSRVRKVTPEGIISTVAGTAVSGYSGDGGPAINAQLRGPAGLALDSSGNLYIADYLDNRVRKVSPDGIIRTVAGKGDSNVPIGDGGPAIKAALAGPLGVTVDASGNLYIADTYFGLVRKVSPDGIITSIAGRNFYTNGLYDIGFPTDLASDLSGNIVAATMASGVRKIAPNGSVTTIAAQNELGITADSSGNLYVADGGLAGIGVAHVRRIAPDGSIADIAGNGVSGYSGDGGPALAASLSPAAAGITVDTAGNIYIADVFNNVIRVLRVVR